MNRFLMKGYGMIYPVLFVVLLFYCSEGEAKPVPLVNNPVEPVFYFKDNSILLLPAYRGNRLQLNALDRLVEEHRPDIGNYYFSIISYVTPREAHQPAALNKASLNGSVVRAYIRQHFRLVNEAFTFQIDTLGTESNRIKVALCARPVPTCISMINYSLNHDPEQVETAMAAYPKIPYLGTGGTGNEAKGTSDPAWNRVIMESVQKTDSLYNRLGQLEQKFSDVAARTDTVFLYEKEQIIVEEKMLPFLGVKTNLMYWIGFTPEMKWKQVMPNLALELYLGNHWSLEFEGAYTRRLVNGEKFKRYAFSSFGAEGRYWFCGNRLYKGFYAGMYVNGGEFDITPKHEDTKGHTGDYVGAGLALGYTYMFSGWFGLEAGVRGCFRHVSYDTYHYHASHYYYENTRYKNGIRLDGVFLNAIFRFSKNSSF